VLRAAGFLAGDLVALDFRFVDLVDADFLVAAGFFVVAIRTFLIFVDS
jgi:hypothetical protein